VCYIGLMGAGIVQVAAQNGLKVGTFFHISNPAKLSAANQSRVCPPVMTDVSDAALDNGRAIITKSLTRIARKLHPTSEADQALVLSSTFANITTTTDAAQAVAETDLIIEAIVENLGVKQALFKRLDELAPKHTIFASNTSSLSIKAIAETSSLARQERFAGFHA
jgi:3-hydroxyacyl-CoA dehydrogenase